MKSFGDKLFKSVTEAKEILFEQGEMAQLTYISYEKFVQFIKEEKKEKIPISFPVGFSADNTPINSTYEYTKEELIERYDFLGLTKLPSDGIFRLVTIIETLLSDIIRDILIEYPAKISSNRKIDAEVALRASSLEEIKIAIVNIILNELAYKSPKDYAAEFKNYVGINLLKKPTFHKYIELKATRDIYLHNSGIANEIYLEKAATLARVKSGEYLPVDLQYFLQSYECCLQLTELFERELDKSGKVQITKSLRILKEIRMKKANQLRKLLKSRRKFKKGKMINEEQQHVNNSY